ncbi:MAG: class I SAM-dependent methyltransferase [Luteibaculum sp.]
MYLDQKTHPVYELKVDVSNVSRLFEYYLLLEKIKPEHSVLDIGCNTGTGMDILSLKSNDVCGIDVIPTLAPILSSKYDSNPKISWKIVDEGGLGFQKKFDWIVASNFIEHVPNPKYYIEEFKKHLKPNGILYLTTVNRNIRLFPWQKPYNQHHFTEYSTRSLKRLVKPYFKECTLGGIIKDEPFFPNYMANSFKQKVDFGIKLPLKCFLMNLKRGRISFKNPVESPENTPPVSTEPNHKIEQFNLDDFLPYFKHLREDFTHSNNWVELVCYCKSENS